MIKIESPASEDNIRALKVGDQVLITGTIITARDMAHKYLVDKRPENLRALLENNFLYHCGPIIGTNPDKTYSAVSAGPTTSIREEPFEADVIENYKIRGVIGKGGMGDKTLAALNQFGAVYLHAAGGAAVYLAKTIQRVREVHLLEEFGVPEALWVFEVVDFPVVVTMDAHKNSLHKEVYNRSSQIYNQLLTEI